MNTAAEILAELEQMGSESYKRVLVKNHGVREPCFGVKIGDMKKIQKRVKKDYQLALDLYETGNYDAMYLAGLIADDARMTKKDLNRWVKAAYAGSLPGTTVAGTAAANPHGWSLAVEWIESSKPLVAAAGWSTLSGIVAIKPDEELDLAALEQLLQRVVKSIHQAPDAARYAMNSFVIALGSYVTSLTSKALAAAEEIGLVTADTGNNSCEVFPAADYIRKVEAHGSLGKKRKSVKC